MSEIGVQQSNGLRMNIADVQNFGIWGFDPLGGISPTSGNYSLSLLGHHGRSRRNNFIMRIRHCKNFVISWEPRLIR